MGLRGLPQESHWSPRAAGVSTIGTRTFHVAVGEVAVAAGAVGKHHPIFVDVLLGEKIQEYILHDLLVVLSPGWW